MSDAHGTKEPISSKERMLIATCNGQPDRVPVAPDISNMVPIRLTGRIFWDIYLDQDPPLWQLYIDALKYYGFDGWFIYGELDYVTDSRVEEEKHVEDVVVTRRRASDRRAPARTSGRAAARERHSWEPSIDHGEHRKIETTVYHTPAGDLIGEMTYYPWDPPTVTRKPIRDLKEDMPKLRYLYPKILDYDDTRFRAMRAAMGDLGIVCICPWLPGFTTWFGLFDEGVAGCTYALADYPDLMEELRVMEEEYILRTTEMMIDAKPDVIMVGASGGITLQSPAIFRQFALPTLKKITRMCKEAGIPSQIHSCGREWDILVMAAEETDLNSINPLEGPESKGDVDLAEAKRLYGHKISLMGNLSTSEVMLRGTPEDVERAAKKAIDDAGAGGGFILSTGDQCGRDTPDENIFKLVEVAKTYGRYDGP